MEWSQDTFLAPHGLDGFEYDLPAKDPMTVIHQFNVQDNDDVERFDGRPSDPGFWEQLKQLPLFKYDRAQSISDPNPALELPSGFCIFFCPRADGAFEHIPSELSDLCFSQTEWENIARTFCLSNLLLKAIRQKISSIAVEPHHLTKKDHYGHTGDDLLMCTITVASANSSQLAVSTTHFRKANLTVAVVFGASPRNIDKIEILLYNSYEAIGHPFLMLGLAAEIMLDKLIDPVENMRHQCVRIMRMSYGMLGRRERIGTTYALQVEDIRSETSWLDESVKANKDNLEKALAVYTRVLGIDEDGKDGMPRYVAKPETGAADFEENLKRYVEYKMKTRFRDIIAELNRLVAVTGISVQDIQAMSTTIMGEFNRRDASDSAQSAKTGTLIAFLAMLYLPITSVATIFATPVFNFQNDWRDWRFQTTASSSPPSPDDDASSDSSSGPVLSGYFWLYLGISIGLTFLTIEGWWRVARIKPDQTMTSDAGRGRGVKWDARQPPHWTLYPIWPYIVRLFPVRKVGVVSGDLKV